MSTWGGYAIVSSHPPQIALTSDSAVDIIELPDSVRPAGLRFVGKQLIEIVDTISQSLLRYRDGKLEEQMPLDWPVRPIQVVASVDGWFALAWSGEELELYRVQQDVWRFLLGLPMEEVEAKRYSISGTGDHVILTYSWAPYYVAVVDAHGAVVWYRTGDEALRSWVVDESMARAFPAIRLGEYVVQTVADTGEDDYRMAMYDSVGRFVKTSRLPAPIVFLGGGATDLVAFRNLAGYPEFSVYSWRLN